jgi:hypothetical protein
MKRILAFCVCLAVLLVSSTSNVAAQSQLEGVWKLEAPQRVLWIFTNKHYSFMVVGSRPDLPPNATDAQKAATWEPFGANSGTYDIKGTILTTHPEVAKNPGVMSPGYFNVYDFTVEGDTLLLTHKAQAARAIPNPQTFKLRRAE